jgi:hypothetical protein
MKKSERASCKALSTSQQHLYIIIMKIEEKKFEFVQLKRQDHSCEMGKYKNSTDCVKSTQKVFHFNFVE